jgi:hypothetical protein
MAYWNYMEQTSKINQQSLMSGTCLRSESEGQTKTTQERTNKTGKSDILRMKVILLANSEPLERTAAVHRSGRSCALTAESLHQSRRS